MVSQTSEKMSLEIQYTNGLYDWTKRLISRRVAAPPLVQIVEKVASDNVTSSFQVVFENATFYALVEKHKTFNKFPITLHFQFMDSAFEVLVELNPSTTSSYLAVFEPPPGLADTFLSLIKALTASLATSPHQTFTVELFDTMHLRESSVGFFASPLLLLKNNLSYYEKRGFVYKGLHDTFDASFPTVLDSIRKRPSQDIFDRWVFSNTQNAEFKIHYTNLKDKFMEAFRDEIDDMKTVGDLVNSMLSWVRDPRMDDYKTILMLLNELIRRMLEDASRQIEFLWKMQFVGTASEATRIRIENVRIY
jgi:hypothetical protein